MEMPGEPLQIGLAYPQLLPLMVENVFAGLHVPLVILLAEPGADLVAGVRGLDIAQVWIDPAQTGAAVFGGEDFHLVTGFELMGERDHPAVHLGPPATMSHLGMNAVGEIDRGRALA